ncbi:MAG: 50S ribosomal protein L11 methyltransferase [Halospina sp.]
MAWVQLHIQSDSEHAELLEQMLLEAGAEAVSMEDSEDTPLYEPERGSTPLWDSTTVTRLFQGDADLAGIQAQVAEAYHSATQTHLESMETELLEDREWERAWMDDFRPERFGSRLWICPSWQDPPEPDAVNIILDPVSMEVGFHKINMPLIPIFYYFLCLFVGNIFALLPSRNTNF